ncbi:MAG: 30S ribosome-binding factor RbfA [Deltaproteobacteria bacterium]|nr:30S ribosome-binding factor RbfA [Deltaproteobacteria bacterium]
MAQGERAARVAEQIQRETARILLEKVDDPVLRAATVTAVRVSADLRHARLRFTTAVELRDEAEKRARRFEPLLQRELARRIRLRYVPEVALRFDEGFEHALRIEKIFEELEAGRPKAGEAETPAEESDDD